MSKAERKAEQENDKYNALIRLAFALAETPRYSLIGHVVMDPRTIKDDEPEGSYHIRISHQTALEIARTLLLIYKDLTEDAKTLAE